MTSYACQSSEGWSEPDRRRPPTARDVQPLRRSARRRRSRRRFDGTSIDRVGHRRNTSMTAPGMRQRALREVLIAATAGDSDRVAGAIDRAPIDQVAAVATLHRVSGPVWSTLRAAGGVPDRVIAELGAVRTANAIRHLGIVGALHEVAALFDEADLRWLVMKGPVLSALYYDDIGDRGYSDLDLLVDHRDFSDAVRLLEAAGFSNAFKDWRLAERMLIGQLEMERGSVRVDLHWHLHYDRDVRQPYAFRPREMVGRRRRVVVSGAEVPTFDPVDTVVTLSFHAARSGGHCLVWSKDLERVLATDRLRSAEVVRTSLAARCGPAVGVMLARARNLLGAPVPDHVVEQLLPAPLALLERAAGAVSPRVPVDSGRTGALSRFAMRSIGPSTGQSVAALPARTRRTLSRRLRPPAAHDTDDPVEKASFLRAVSAAPDG